MKPILALIKPYLRWIIVGGTLFFLLKSFKDHWQEIAEIQITARGWLYLVLALLITTVAHLFSGSVWILTLKALKQPIEWLWGLQVYLKTNIAKYLPGNVWHFYGRIVALKNRGMPLSVASFSVLLEPLLIAAAAFMVALVGLALGTWSFQALPINQGLRSLLFIILAAVLIGIHPIILNPILQIIKKLKVKDNPNLTIRIECYPWLPLISSLGFLILRGVGFVLTLGAFMSLNLTQIPLLFSVFSLAWLLGLIIPGAPGGIGVFETTALIFLEQAFFPGLLLSALAVFRVISITAEVIGAGLALLSEKIGKTN